MKALKTFSLCPEDQRPHPSVPLDWPWQTVIIDESQQSVYEQAGFTVLADAGYTAYLEERQATYDTWFAAYQIWLATNPEFVGHSIIKTKAWADGLMEDVKTLKILNNVGVSGGLWVHHRFRAITYTVDAGHVSAFPPLAPLLGVTITTDLINLIVTGDVESAYGVLVCTVPDDMTQPYHCVSQALLDYIKGRIAQFLGWA